MRDKVADFPPNSGDIIGEFPRLYEGIPAVGRRVRKIPAKLQRRLQQYVRILARNWRFFSLPLYSYNFSNELQSVPDKVNYFKLIFPLKLTKVEWFHIYVCVYGSTVRILWYS